MFFVPNAKARPQSSASVLEHRGQRFAAPFTSPTKTKKQLCAHISCISSSANEQQRERSSRGEGNGGLEATLLGSPGPAPPSLSSADDGSMDRSRGGIRPRRGYIWRWPVVGGAGKRGWIAGQGSVCNPGAARADSDAEISPDLSLPPRFSIGLLRRNRHLASPVDDSDRRPPRCLLSVPAGLSAITSPPPAPRLVPAAAVSEASLCSGALASLATRESRAFRCNMQRGRLQAGSSSNDGRCLRRASRKRPEQLLPPLFF